VLSFETIRYQQPAEPLPGRPVANGTVILRGLPGIHRECDKAWDRLKISAQLDGRQPAPAIGATAATAAGRP